MRRNGNKARGPRVRFVTRRWLAPYCVKSQTPRVRAAPSKMRESRPSVIEIGNSRAESPSSRISAHVNGVKDRAIRSAAKKKQAASDPAKTVPAKSRYRRAIWHQNDGIDERQKKKKRARARLDRLARGRLLLHNFALGAAPKLNLGSSSRSRLPQSR